MDIFLCGGQADQELCQRIAQNFRDWGSNVWVHIFKDEDSSYDNTGFFDLKGAFLDMPAFLDGPSFHELRDRHVFISIVSETTKTNQHLQSVIAWLSQYSDDSYYVRLLTLVTEVPLPELAASFPSIDVFDVIPLSFHNLDMAVLKNHFAVDGTRTTDGALSLPQLTQDALLRLAKLYFLQGQHAQSRTVLWEAQQRDPSSLIIKNLLTRSYLDEVAHYEDALRLATEVLQVDPTNIAALGNASWTLAHLQRFEEAEYLGKKACLFAIENNTTWIVLSMIYKMMEDFTKALQCIEIALLIDVWDPYLWFEKGYLLNELHHYDVSLAAYNQALILKPRDPIAHLNRGNIKKTLGHYEEALLDYTVAQSLDPAEMLNFYNKGLTLALMERYAEALQEYQAALLLEPGDTDILSEIGLVLNQLERFPDAIVLFKQLLAAHPESDTVVLEGLCYALCKMNGYQEALAYCDSALQKEPLNENLMILREHIIHELGI